MRKAKTATRKIDEILNAALYLFSTRGYVKTSMTDVAEAVNMTKGGIYHYIAKKEDLLVQLHNQMADAFIREFRASAESSDQPQRQLDHWIEAHVRLMRDYRHHIKIFFNELNSLQNTEKLHTIIGKRDDIFALLETIIKTGRKQRVFRTDMQPKIISFLIFGMINWFYQWYNPDGPRRLDDITDDIKKIVFNGVMNKDLF